MRILLMVIFVIPSMSFGAEMLLWNDHSGIVQAESCHVSYIESSQSKILGTNNNDIEIVQAHDANFNYQVYSGSLVSLVAADQESSIVKVLSYQGQQKADQLLLAKNGSLVKVNNHQIQDVGGKILTLSGESHRVFSDEFQSESINLSQTQNRDGYKIVNCFGNKYQVFNVLDGQTYSKISEVGINLEKANIAAHIHFRSKAFNNDQMIPSFGTDKFNLFAHVVCSESKEVDVMNNVHSLVLFKTRTGEEIIPFQGFDKEEAGGDKLIYQKVKFADREEGKNIGWILKKYIKLTSECPYIEPPAPEDDDQGDVQEINEFVFPLVQKPTHPYDSGMRKFGARRSQGRRLHAANDLYRKVNDAVVAVQNGKIIRPLYYFYLGTYAIEVKHDSGLVVRYGEISSKSPAGSSLGLGSIVKTKDIVGFIGRLNTGCCNPMLHFELYSGEGTGLLTDSNSPGKFKRRWDLLDPTNYLKDWEKSLP